MVVFRSISITIKRHAVVNPALSSTLKQPKPTSALNRELCVFCQTETNEALQCPARSSKLPVGSGYMSLADNLSQFKDLGIIPLDLDVEKLDKGIGIQETLMIHSAKWHKTCSLKFNKQALQRVSRKQIKQGSQNAGTSGVQTRSAFSHTTALDLCFFCNEPAGTTNLHEASTHKLDMKVRRCALQLEDSELPAKLSAQVIRLPLRPSIIGTASPHYTTKQDKLLKNKKKKKTIAICMHCFC